MLARDCRLTPADPVADVGSGTGFLAELFLRHGNPVFGVEPNREMREAGEQLLRGYSQFRSVDGTAEATTLPDRCAQFVTAGQAFHWFDPVRTKGEFARILRPGGWVVLVWNERLVDTTPFLQAYERLLNTYGEDYQRVASRQMDDAVLADFFSGGGYRRQSLDNEQRLDYAGLEGRLLSSSYAPVAGHPQHEFMLAELREIFERYQERGNVVLGYRTQVYFGHVPTDPA
jgi:SAM-dependent methyltransferase